MEEGIAGSPGYLAGKVARARYLFELGRPAEALDEAEDVLVADPSQLVAAKLCVRAALRLGDRARSESCLERYRALGTGDSEIAELAAEVGALQPMERISVTLGQLYLQQGHRREAREIFGRLLAVDPDDVRARQGLARAI